jgi:hypothetical protein
VAWADGVAGGGGCMSARVSAVREAGRAGLAAVSVAHGFRPCLRPRRGRQAGRAARPLFKPIISTYIDVFAQKRRVLLSSQSHRHECVPAGVVWKKPQQPQQPLILRPKSGSRRQMRREVAEVVIFSNLSNLLDSVWGAAIEVDGKARLTPPCGGRRPGGPTRPQAARNRSRRAGRLPATGSWA